MLYTILTVDIDQFELVTVITWETKRFGISCIDIIPFMYFQFVPTEFFNLNIKYWFEDLTTVELMDKLIRIPWSIRKKFTGLYGLEEMP